MSKAQGARRKAAQSTRAADLDGDAFLALQVHRVHLGAHAVLAAHLAARSGVAARSLRVAALYVQPCSAALGRECAREHRCGEATAHTKRRGSSWLAQAAGATQAGKAAAAAGRRAAGRTSWIS